MQKTQAIRLEEQRCQYLIGVPNIINPPSSGSSKHCFPQRFPSIVMRNHQLIRRGEAKTSPTRLSTVSLHISVSHPRKFRELHKLISNTNNIRVDLRWRLATAGDVADPLGLSKVSRNIGASGRDTAKTPRRLSAVRDYSRAAAAFFSSQATPGSAVITCPRVVATNAKPVPVSSSASSSRPPGQS